VLQEGEISADLFTFHEAVSQLQLLEEEVLDSHTSVAEMGPQWTELDHALLAMTNDVDYDQDGEVPSHHSTKNKWHTQDIASRRACKTPPPPPSFSKLQVWK
jgi:ABC-type uncharacterized transport system YnjBCD substrate-binding protein